MNLNSTPSSDEHRESLIEDLLSRMTLDEKFEILVSHGLRRFYSTGPIKRLAIGSFKMADGPLGVAYHSSWKKNTRFPATKALAATWNRSLALAMGVAIAEEVRALKRHMILAPGVNIDRTPLNGRTFEYYSEDPYLTKELAMQFVKGVQSLGVGACVKHFVANNQETDRRRIDAIIDERTLNEIYLRAFREIVINAEPLAVMACYNKVNGTYGCAHRKLIRETLMEQWGFKGMVISDWFATGNIKSTSDCVNAGLTLEMPWPKRYKIKNLRHAFDAGEFTQETLDDLVRRNLRAFFTTGVIGGSSVPQGSRNTSEHQELARRIAEEGVVLLKNAGDLLPLNIDAIETLSLHGPNLRKKFGKLLYGGSSAVVPPYEVTALEGIKRHCKGRVRIVKEPSDADVSIVFAGLNHNRGGDSEFADRKSLELPKKQIDLIHSVLDRNPRTVVVLISGSPIAMNGWLERTPAVLEAWYPGMEGGTAIANILFGEVTPSGKLPITFPKQLNDSPAHASGSLRTFPGDEEERVHYEEGIFVGYRWFDAREIDPLFPFGFGLSYTQFEIVDITSNTNISDTKDSIILQIRVKNTGNRRGAEVIQVYANQTNPSVPRPPKELVGFEKCDLQPGETSTVTIEIKVKELGYYSTKLHGWTVDSDEYRLSIGNSSRSLHGTLQVEI